MLDIFGFICIYLNLIYNVFNKNLCVCFLVFLPWFQIDFFPKNINVYMNLSNLIWI